MQTADVPKLGAPGAGLPALELLFARIGFGVYRRLRDRDFALAQFNAEATRVLSLVNSIPHSAAATPILVPRLRGIEDSSRYWSPFMTVQHLVIVNTGILRMIQSLASGEEGTRVVSTADVKPSPGAGADVILTFERGVADYAAALTKISDLHTDARQAHPWFGPLDAHGWHCLAAVHHSIHRKQIQTQISLMRDSRRSSEIA